MDQAKIDRYNYLLRMKERFTDEQAMEFYHLTSDIPFMKSIGRQKNPSNYIDTFNQIAEREHGPDTKNDIWADRNLQIEMDEKIENNGPIVHLELIDCYVTAF